MTILFSKIYGNLVYLLLKIMGTNGHSFLSRVLSIVQDETDSKTSLINFKHPEELKVFFLLYNFQAFME